MCCTRCCWTSSRATATTRRRACTRRRRRACPRLDRTLAPPLSSFSLLGPNVNDGSHDLIYQVAGSGSGISDPTTQAATNYAQTWQSSVNSTALNLNELGVVTQGNIDCASARSAISASTAISCGIKLVSGLLKNSRYLPLLALKGAGLTLEITLADHKTAFCNTALAATLANTDAGLGGGVPANANTPASNDGITAGGLSSYSVQNVEYIGQTIDFDEAFTATFMAMIQVGGVERPI